MLIIFIGKQVPLNSYFHTLIDSVGRGKAQAMRCFTDIGLTVTHIASSKGSVAGLAGRDRWQCFTRLRVLDVVAQQCKEHIKRGAIPHGHVVYLIAGISLLRGRSQQVCLHGVGHKAEVAAGFAVAVDVDGLAFKQCGRPFGDDGGIGAIGVLAGAEHVEVAQADGVKAVAAGKHVGIQLVDVFGDGVGAQGFANVVFDLGQRGVVAVGAAAGGVGEALHLGVACGYQHVEETGDVGVVGGDGVCQAAGD